MAIATLMHMEKKFTKQLELRENYTKLMQEYEKLGHMV